MQLPESYKLQPPLLQLPPVQGYQLAPDITADKHFAAVSLHILATHSTFEGQKVHPYSNLYIILVNYTVGLL